MARPGRPRLDRFSSVPSAAVHLKLSASDYDRADKLRRLDRDKSIQETIRRGLKRFLDERGNSI